jgi:UDPglucose 6-dehydrogenase
LLSESNNVLALDINNSKIKLLKKKQSPFHDEDISKALINDNLNITFEHISHHYNWDDFDFAVISIPTDYKNSLKSFDTSALDKIIKLIISKSLKITIVIKSTVPIGYTKYISNKLKTNRILFSPEFLREGKALFDNYNPSRIIVSNENKTSITFAKLLSNGTKNNNKNIILINSTEAESIKLFANAYLALRISFFNEVDSFALYNKLNTKNIINGICMDSRIGNFYNNPSFGFGGYCLPKDTKQLNSNFNHIPQSMIKAIQSSNNKRIKFIANDILLLNKKKIGVYKLSVKKDSDNTRTSSTEKILKILSKNKKIKILIYEPLIKMKFFNNIEVTDNLDYFFKRVDLIIANRIDGTIMKYNHRVYTRDIFEIN